MKSKMKHFLLDTTLVLLVLLACAVIILAGASVAIADNTKKYEAGFTADGGSIRPSGWYECEVNPVGMFLDERVV